jgi:hypothetical protein
LAGAPDPFDLQRFVEAQATVHGEAKILDRIVIDKRLNSPPPLTVVVPIYGTAAYVAQTLDSLVRNGAEHVELVLINDGSPDNSEEIARDWLACNEVSGVLIAMDNRGPSAARNRGMKECRTRYLTFLDSDDLFDANTHRKAIAVADAHDVDYVYMRATCFDCVTGEATPFFDAKVVDQVLRGNAQVITTLADEPCLIRLDVNLALRILRSDFVRRIGLGYCEGMLFEDIPAQIRTVGHAGKVAVLAAYGLRYRLARPGQITTARGRSRFDMITSARLSLDEIRQLNLSTEAGAWVAGMVLQKVHWAGTMVDFEDMAEYFRKADEVSQAFPESWRSLYASDYALDDSERSILNNFNARNIQELMGMAGWREPETVAVTEPAPDEITKTTMVPPRGLPSAPSLSKLRIWLRNRLAAAGD